VTARIVPAVTLETDCTNSKTDAEFSLVSGFLRMALVDTRFYFLNNYSFTNLWDYINLMAVCFRACD
jgi:hypothetical protein